MRSDPRTGTFTTSDGCDIAFTVRPADLAGSPRLALIHPLGLDGTIWNEVARQLNGSVELLTYDCRGHGRSGRPAMPFTTDLFANDLAQLLDHLDWPIVTVAGCSMGGCVAQAFAARHPLRLNGLGLIDTTAWYGADAPQKWRDRIAAIRAQGLKGMLEFQSQRWFSDAFRQQQPATVARVNDILLRNDVDCYAATCIMLGDADLRGFQSSIRVPVAVVVGEEDYATPVAMSQQMHAAIPGSTLKVLTEVRHLAPVEAPEQVSLQLLALLDRIGSN
jgi:3-oxoadipate enol-lactonase